MMKNKPKRHPSRDYKSSKEQSRSNKNRSSKPKPKRQT